MINNTLTWHRFQQGKEAVRDVRGKISCPMAARDVSLAGDSVLRGDVLFAGNTSYRLRPPRIRSLESGRNKIALTSSRV